MTRHITYGYLRTYVTAPDTQELKRLLNDTYATAVRMGITPGLVRVAVECLQEGSYDIEREYVKCDDTNIPTADISFHRNSDGGTTASGPTRPAGNTIKYDPDTDTGNTTRNTTGNTGR